jgi:hypothetical protein
VAVNADDNLHTLKLLRALGTPSGAVLVDYEVLTDAQYLGEGRHRSCIRW